jgi:hypothetical protein
VGGIFQESSFYEVNMKKAGLCILIVVLLLSLAGCAGAAGQKNAAPGAPGGQKLVIVENGFKLTWTPSPDDPVAVTGYEIVRADLASGPFVAVGRVGKGVFEYVDTTAAREVIYYYKVRAMAGSVYSPDSNTVTGER